VARLGRRRDGFVQQSRSMFSRRRELVLLK
jgi:hypothetical protein